MAASIRWKPAGRACGIPGKESRDASRSPVLHPASSGLRNSCERAAPRRTRAEDKAAASRGHALPHCWDPPGLQITTIMLFGLWSSPEEPQPERVPLPLQALDRCSVCESQRKLRLCANCGEVRLPEITFGGGTCLRRYSSATLLLK